MMKHRMWLAVFGLFAIGCAGPAGMHRSPGPDRATGMTGSQGQPGMPAARVASAPVARWTPLKDIRFDCDRAGAIHSPRLAVATSESTQRRNP